jgi:alpha-glucoside transport system permease protein
MPMAISFAGAAITWRLIYDFRPEGFGSNIGLLNGIWMGLGHQPVAWLQQDPWNNLLLMVIMVWMQTGFAMVVLSAAIKAIPEEITEARGSMALSVRCSAHHVQASARSSW